MSSGTRIETRCWVVPLRREDGFGSHDGKAMSGGAHDGMPWTVARATGGRWPAARGCCSLLSKGRGERFTSRQNWAYSSTNNNT
uniref:Uncharacterized protein n=1 Tax=Oryza nivara TaxID=4536 RepID=A0A0E0GHZ3_ORYNI